MKPRAQTQWGQTKRDEEMRMDGMVWYHMVSYGDRLKMPNQLST